MSLLSPSDIEPIGEHRGVPLHDHQDEARLTVVRAEIDHVIDVISANIPALVEYAKDRSRPPEARILAFHLVEAHRSVAAESRQERPAGVDLEDLCAHVSGLGSRRWRSRRTYGTVLDEDGQVPREVPLPRGEGI